MFINLKHYERRPVQKESKRIECKSYILVTCLVAEPDYATLKRRGDHNHTPGSYSDLKHMATSENLRKTLRNFYILQGFSRREIRTCLLQQMDGDADADTRDKYFHYDDVYNIRLSVAQAMFKFKKDETESIKVWSEGYHVIEFSCENIFYYGMISPWQNDIMKVSLDSTFSVSSRSIEVSYSLVVRHPDTGKGVPVGYLITNDQSVTPVLKVVTVL